ncbi:MAG TPA: hypothetical protein ENJ67_02315 [Sulfurimonas autotrophica]|uniref:DUF4175 domain-containing protein n=1 Tax=Sulfurimonas autotrophica TaxID=202747 RepID=A0A7C3C2E0_9BACT|nr:hypothetical protein [Sulfurimonas autotrophica]
MKFAKITLSVALLGALTLGMADETASAETTVSVDAQIAAIQAAPAQERVQMMNEFKQRLATMNQADRMAAIAQMQEKMQGKAQAGKEFGSATREQAKNAKENGVAMGEQTRTRAQEMAQEKQMQANEQMTQMQNMNQMQAGSQFNHMNMSGGATGSGSMNFMNH